jgi:hypothetical protein
VAAWTKTRRLKMSKAQTDIRSTSYDELAARTEGYQGSIDSVIAQIRGEGGAQSHDYDPTGRTELRIFLGVPPKHESVSAGPSVELDVGVWYGEPELGIYEPGFYGLDHAKSRGWVGSSVAKGGKPE